MGQHHGVAGENGLDTGLKGHFELKGIKRKSKTKEPTIIVHNGKKKRSVQDDEGRFKSNVWGERQLLYVGTIWIQSGQTGVYAAFTIHLCTLMHSLYIYYLCTYPYHSKFTIFLSWLSYYSSTSHKCLCGNTNNTAGRTSTGVTSLLGLLVTTTAKVVSTGVDDEGTAENALSTEQLHELVFLGANGVTLSVGLEVAQVTNVTLGVLGSTVGLAVGVDCSTLALFR